jgi:D-alanyl-D-alanine carboxypeptidase
MRNFVAIIAIASIVGIATARHGFSAQAAGSDQPANSTIDRLSDIAARPLQRVLPPPPPPPVLPPVNEAGSVFEGVLSAEGVIAVDHVTDAVLFEKNAHNARPLASITKLMSLLIIAERIPDWSATTTISAEVVEEGNQTVGAGEVYSMEDLYDAAIVGSYNTAVSALVAGTGMTQEEFVREMNRRARDFDMEGMSFVEPTGLSPDNIGTPADVARLMKIALSHPRVKVSSMLEKATITELKTKKKKVVHATDWLLTNTVVMKGAHVEGGKTGYIPEAGYNFAGQIKSDEGHEIRVVVLGATDVYSRFTETASIAEWIFENFEWVSAKEKY